LGENNGKIEVGKNGEFEWNKNGKQRIGSFIFLCHAFVYNEGKQEWNGGNDINIPPSINIILENEDGLSVQELADTSNNHTVLEYQRFATVENMKLARTVFTNKE